MGGARVPQAAAPPRLPHPALHPRAPPRGGPHPRGAVPARGLRGARWGHRGGRKPEDARGTGLGLTGLPSPRGGGGRRARGAPVLGGLGLPSSAFPGSRDPGVLQQVSPFWWSDGGVGEGKKRRRREREGRGGRRPVLCLVLLATRRVWYSSINYTHTVQQSPRIFSSCKTEHPPLSPAPSP